MANEYLIPARCRTHTGEHGPCSLHIRVVGDLFVLKPYEVPDTCAAALNETVAAALLDTFTATAADEDVVLEPHRLRDPDPVNGCVIVVDKASTVWLTQLLRAWLYDDPWPSAE